jgi:hypothetical protein
MKQRMKTIFGLFRLKSFNYESFEDMIVRNHGHSLVGIALRLIPTMGGHVKPGTVKEIKYFFKFCSKLVKSGGLPFLVKYLKNASVLTQQGICGHRNTITLPRVKTKGGLPCIFPSRLRKLIRLGNLFYIRLSLTLLSFYRDLLYKSPVKISTITSPFTGDDKMIDEIIGFIPKFVENFIPKSLRGREVLMGKFKYFPILTSSPQSGTTKFELDNFKSKPTYKDWVLWGISNFSISSTNPITLLRSAVSLTAHQIEALCVLYSLSLSLKPKVSWWSKEATIAKDQSNYWVNPKDLIKIIRSQGSLILKGPYKPFKNFTGKLGLKQEAAGKMRVFAMMDPWTQWAMYPFHKSLFNILRSRRMVDGTFNQLGPINRLMRVSKDTPMFSMDLSSATDRLPMSLQTPLIAQIFNLEWFEAISWQTLMIDRDFLVPQSGGKSIRYAVGQPMGALSSWAMLAMTHHLILMYAAMKVKGTICEFTNYAILGDDIVILDTKVAKEYHKIITKIGVECNLAKSIISPKGLGLEFAKRTFFKGENVSPSPFKELYSSLTDIVVFLEYVRKYKLTIQEALKVAGFGWRVISQFQKPYYKLNLKVRYLVFLLSINEKERFIKLFRNSLKFGYNQFIVGFYSFLYSYAVSVRDRCSRMNKIISRTKLSHWSACPETFEWLIKSSDGLESFIKTPYTSFVKTPFSKLFYKKNNIRGGYLTLIKYLNESMLKSVQELVLTAWQKTEDLMKSLNLIDKAIPMRERWWTKDINKYFPLPPDPHMYALTAAIAFYKYLLLVESDLSRRSITDLSLRPEVPESKKPGEPKIFRAHQSFTHSFHRLRKSKLIKHK